MRRAFLSASVVLAGLFSFATVAQAAVPTVGPLSATDIQGVSAVLKGEVNPEGLSATYRFEYASDSAFKASGFAMAIKTPLASAGLGSGPHPARAAIGGLTANTTYHYRLTASNSSGPASAEATFATTGGFGFQAGVEGFEVQAIAEGGGAANAAGSHPYQLNLGLRFNAGGEFEDQPGVEFPDGDLRDLAIDLPSGLTLNPTVLPTCSAEAFAVPRSSPYEAPSLSGESCPDQSQVGTVEVQSARAGGKARRFGLFNLAPPPGVAAQLGFAPYGSPVVLDLAVRNDPSEVNEGAYAFSLKARNVPQSLDLSALTLGLWGTPWAASHNGERGNCLNEAEPQFPWAKCSVGRPGTFPPLAYVTMPGRCSGTLDFSVEANAWQQPATVEVEALNRNSSGTPVQLGSCAQLELDSTPSGFLTDKKASSPSGYNFRLADLNLGLTTPALTASPPVKTIVAHLPSGVTVNPSVGAGLGTCSPAQFAAETATSAPGAGCPNGSKIGDFTVRTQLFTEPFEGAIYLATPDEPGNAPGAENPFDTVVAVYLVAKAPARGVQIKLAGRMDPDPNTGNLVATFDNLPQLPYTDLDLTFRTGQRAFLITPPACGAANSQLEVSSWASVVPARTTTTSSPIDTGVGGGPCPSGTPPFAPDAITGAVNSNVGSYTPYFIHLTRKDTEQEITSYSLTLPKGVTGKLAGIPFCPDAAIAAARTKRGVAETASPSCPLASQVGRTLTGYGVGAALTYAPGRIFLAGPYHGAPLSLVTINSATVGPFDLGTIVVRSAFQVNPLTAQLQIDSKASDPIPHIIDGIPLHLRDVRIYADRYQFTHNPSSCEPSQLVSTLTGSGASFSNPADDSSAIVSRHFQLLNCLTLGFQPKLGMRLRGGSKRGDYPSLRATFAARGPQDSNLKRIDVTMPHSEFLAQNHIKTICTRVQFDAERCPDGSVYGHAVAYTPLFDEPLRGDVYLRSSSHRLPDLVASLRSGAIRIVLEGKIGPAKQGIRALFDNLPDAPIERFTMTLYGGKRGLLVNSANICASPPAATVRALAQNNIGSSFTTTLRGQCKGKSAKRKGRGQ
jgi:hypothetical protein